MQHVIPQHHQPTSSPDPILRPRDAARYLGISRSTLYELIDRGLLEAPFPTGVRAVGWRESTLNAYLERRAAEHRAVIAARPATKKRAALMKAGVAAT